MLFWGNSWVVVLQWQAGKQPEPLCLAPSLSYTPRDPRPERNRVTSNDFLSLLLYMQWQNKVVRL